MAREHLWAVYLPAHGPPDGAHIRGFHELAIAMDRAPDPPYTAMALEMIDRVMPVFEAAQQWPEAGAIAEAHHSMEAFDKTPILTEIQRVVARDRIGVVTDCPVCGEIG
jgi:hypothetical protein